MRKINQNKKTPYTARAALCALTMLSLCITLSIVTEAVPRTTTLPFAAVWVLGVYGLWWLYGAWLALPRPFAQARLWGLAVLFAGILTIGRSFAELGTAELVTAHKLKALLFLIGRVPLCYAAMRLVLHALEKQKQPGEPKHTALFFTGVLLFCWLPYWALTFPGTVSNDSITQLSEILGVVPLSNGNPVFQTWLINVFRHIGGWFGGADAAVALYCAVQALLMAWLLGSFLRRMAKSAAPRWLVYAALAFYALCPIFPLFAFCMGKDTNFAMAVLWLSLNVVDVMNAVGVKMKAPASKPTPFPAPRTFCLCLSAALCALLRNPGVYLALLTLSLLLVYTLIHSRHPHVPASANHALWLAPICAICSVLCVFIALHALIIPALHIAPMPETEEYSIPLQQVARVAASVELSDAEATAIDGVLEMDKLQSEYNGDLSDPIKLLWREDATAAQKQAFWKTWLGLLAKRPATCMSATFHNTYGYLYPGYMSTLKPTLLIGKQGRTTKIDGLFDFTVNPKTDALKGITNRLAENPLYRLLISPGIYGWLTLLAGVCLLQKGKRRFLLAAVPALFTLAGCMFSAVNAYFRYAMPLYLCAPLLMWLCTYPIKDQEGSVGE